MRAVSIPQTKRFQQGALPSSPELSFCISCRSVTSSGDDDSELEGLAVEVFVGGLPPDTTEEEVQQAFAAVGQVTGLRLNRRKRTGECKGFGFVRYTDQATAEKACSEVREVCVLSLEIHTKATSCLVLRATCRLLYKRPGYRSCLGPM